jgi:histidinol phosphatase-like enzyme
MGAGVSNKIKVIFFGVTNTLGTCDPGGNLDPYLPSTEQLLEGCSKLGVKLGVITNLSKGLSDNQVKDMIANAEMSQNQKTGKPHTIGQYIPRANIITNAAAKADKPAKEIYEYACNALGVSPSECLYVGANLLEVVGAHNAGMQAERKECPPGTDFLQALVGKIGASPVDSGWQFEALFKHEHLLGERIFTCGDEISKRLEALAPPTAAPPLDAGKWVSAPVVTIPEDVRRAMGYFVHLLDHFANQVHLKAEESMLEIAVACGMPQEDGRWVKNQHDQARAYWASINVAWQRILTGDDDDRWFAIVDFYRSTEAFVYLFKYHAVRENDWMYPTAGSFFNAIDDAMVLNLASHFGPADISPFIWMVGQMEQLLKLPSPPDAPVPM